MPDKKIIAFVLYPGVTLLDAIGPYTALRGVPDIEVRFVAHEVGPVPDDSTQLYLSATHTFYETPDPAVIVVPGSGIATDTAIADTGLIEWLQRTAQSAQWVTSVCTGSVILAAAGLLEGRAATSHWGYLSRLEAFGIEARPDDRIVEDGRFVTAAGVSAGIDFGLWLAARLSDELTAKSIQLMMEYDPQPPFDSGHMSKAEADVIEKVFTDLAALTAP